MRRQHESRSRVTGEGAATPTLAEDRDAIRDLFGRYCTYIDEARGEEWASTYTDDGSFVNDHGEAIVGRDALKAFADSQPVGIVHHILTNHVIDVDGADAVASSSVLVLVNGAVVSSGHTRNELRRVDGAWRIHRRTYTPDPRTE